ncbi:MAG: ATP-binding cassette domain-containing protein [Coriobacteriia bacterium]|nr:ATP-binding cassette domain-containing protein [Coriobacteriia bacterium]
MSVALEFDNFSFAYPEGTPVLQGVSCSVPAGAFVVLVGETGSGKTTLLRCAHPVLAPVGTRSGQVRVAGQALESLGPAASGALVGMVAQSPENQLVCDSVWHQMAFGLENLGMDPQEMRRRVAEVAHYFGIQPWFHQDVNQLSGGQQQLLNLASVLVMQPQVLLLDEPTAQLDPVAQRNFCHALFRLNRELGLTVVVATHAPQLFSAYATQALLLREGTVVPCSMAAFRERPFDVPAAWPAPTDLRSAVVTLQDVHVRYAREAPPILRGMDLRVPAGSICALVGGNGSGKTTVLNTVAGVLKPFRGKVANTALRTQALLPQDPKALFVKDTALDELMEWSKPCGYGREDAQRWLERLGLQACEHQHPYDLSGGQQQLLAFAKLALTKPGLLLLDEPAKGLDAHSTLALAQLIRQFATEGGTVLFATHNLAFAACVAQRVVLLFDGQAACEEAPADFFRRNVFYRPVADAFTEAFMAAASGGAGASEAAEA